MVSVSIKDFNGYRQNVCTELSVQFILLDIDVPQ